MTVSCFPRWLSGKELSEDAEDAGDLGPIPQLGRSPGRGNGNPLQYTCLKKSHGQGSLAGYGPWGRKELDTIEHTYMPMLLPMWQ